jgi:hypothetical protein
MGQKGAFRRKATNGSSRAKRTILTRPVARAAALAVVAVALLPARALAAPAAPVFFDPDPNAFVNTDPVHVAGTSSGDTVLVRITEGVTILADTGPSGGYWAANVSLADGAHTVRARAQDAGGAWSAFSDPLTFTVDTVAPAAPAITSPPAGSTVTFTPVTVEGTAEPGAHVRVDVSTGGSLTATADGAGNWMATRAFTDTSHTLVAKATDEAGNVSLASAPVTFTVDTRAPSPPIVYTPANGTFWNTTAVSITGSAEPGSTVEVYEGVTIVMTVVASDGTWSGAPAFTPGAHTIQARATDPAGHVGAFSPSITFTVDLVAPAAPVIARPLEGSYVPYDYDVTGTAEPYATVQLVKNVQVVATTTADSSGTWTIHQQSFSGGQLIKARAKDRAGNVGPLSAPRAFTVDASPPSPPQITTPDGRIFLPTEPPRIDGTAADDIGVLAVSLEYYDILGQAYPFQNANCYVCPAVSVDWQSTYAPPIGVYEVKAFAIDRAGNRSLPARVGFVRL